MPRKDGRGVFGATAEIAMRVLLVEDDPTTSRSIEMMLTHANLNGIAPIWGKKASTSRSSTITT